MYRNPITRARQEAQRVARTEAVAVTVPARGAGDATASQSAGSNDPDSGRWYPAGLTGITTLGPGFRCVHGTKG